MKEQYFSPEFFSFFENLSQNNCKSWFDEHKQDYETHVKSPFLHFVSDALDELIKLSPFIKPDPKKCIFRINRDVRFSIDKSPYKTNVSAILSEGGTKSHEIPSFYVDFSEKTAFLGGGAYFIDNKKLPLVREYIVQNYKEFKDIIESPVFTSFFHQLDGEENKKLLGDLKGLEKEFPLILKKQYYFMRKFDSNILLKSNLMELTKNAFEAGLEFNKFMLKAFLSAG